MGCMSDAKYQADKKNEREKKRQMQKKGLMKCLLLRQYEHTEKKRKRCVH